MKLTVFSASTSFNQLLEKYFDLDTTLDLSSELRVPARSVNHTHLLHISSLGDKCFEWLDLYAASNNIHVGICSDRPNILEMLECVQSGAKAYCNSYMDPALYLQMIRLLDNNQSWFPPHLLEQTFNLAHQASRPSQPVNSVEILTVREKEIARAVAQGNSNKQISNLCQISERTVKAHLTSIFRKLDLKDRVALVLYLNNS
jgi:DNA-binding NarL/FixJ family response regulator